MKSESYLRLDRLLYIIKFCAKCWFKIILLGISSVGNSNASEIIPDSTIERLISINRYYIELTASRPRDYRTIFPLLEYFNSIRDTKLKANAAFILGHYYRSVFDGVNCLKYFSTAADLYKQSNQWGLYLNATKDICDMSRAVGNLEIIEPTLIKCLKIPQKHHVGFYILDPIQQLMVHLSFTKGDYRGAIKYGLMFIDSLSKYQKLDIKNDDFEYTKSIDAKIVDLELGHSYLALGKLDTAEFYLRRAEVYFLQHGDNEKLSRTYRHLAILASHQGKRDSIVSNLNKFDKYLEANSEARTGVLFKLPKLTRSLESINNAYLESQKKVLYLTRQNYSIVAFFVVTIVLVLLVLWSERKSRLKQNEINQLLKKDFERSEKLNEEKGKYFSILSHELRTPIFAITGLAKLFEDPSHITKENIEAIINSGNHLLHLVNNVLQHNKLEESKQVALDEVDFDVRQTMEEILQTTSYLAGQKDIEAKFHIDLGGSECLFGDKQKLAQILVNLISNAIRYSPRYSKVEVTLNEENTSETFRKLHFSVRDNGIGIEASQMPHLFDYRKTTYDPKREGADNIKGMGIGLFVVSSFIKAMGSKVIVESTPGIGSVFSFDLILKNGQSLKDPFPNVQQNKKNVNVLVVDDMKINQIVTQKTLNSIGVNGFVATDSDPIIEIIEEKKIDLILMDLNMRLVSGYDLSLKIRQAGISIPIIAHTASTEENIDHSALKVAGIQDYLIKPYSLNELKAKLQKYLEIRF